MDSFNTDTSIHSKLHMLNLSSKIFSSNSRCFEQKPKQISKKIKISQKSFKNCKNNEEKNPKNLTTTQNYPPYNEKGIKIKSLNLTDKAYVVHENKIQSIISLNSIGLKRSSRPNINTLAENLNSRVSLNLPDKKDLPHKFENSIDQGLDSRSKKRIPQTSSSFAKLIPKRSFTPVQKSKHITASDFDLGNSSYDSLEKIAKELNF